MPNGRLVRYAGIVTVRQQPETANGTIFVSLEDTIRSFKAVCDGEGDHLPEGAFYNVGTFEDALAKGAKMAAEA